MKKVRFVHVKTESEGLQYGHTMYSFSSAEPVIAEQIKNGWDYKGFIPLICQADGSINELSLIFEKEDNEE
ncbi:MAG: DUF4177 domain-containing protein [Clostridia bacterium]|nr:DUF4177 domain-containing protein [Clostridia bacterium]